jgi:transcriptional regulator with XRE-family HTH domain
MNFTKISAATTALSIGARLKALRVQRGLTLQKVAQPLGVTRSCVSQWERGRSAPGAKYFEQLAETLGTSVVHLLTGSDEPAPTPSGAIQTRDIVLRARKDIARALGVDLSQVRVEIDETNG